MGRRAEPPGDAASQLPATRAQGHDGDCVGDVDHGAQELVNPDVLGEPVRAAPSLPREGSARDQAQRCLQVTESLRAAGLATRMVPVEQVDVEQYARQLADAHAARPRGGITRRPPLPSSQPGDDQRLMRHSRTTWPGQACIPASTAIRAASSDPRSTQSLDSSDARSAGSRR